MYFHKTLTEFHVELACPLQKKTYKELYILPPWKKPFWEPNDQPPKRASEKWWANIHKIKSTNMKLPYQTI